MRGVGKNKVVWNAIDWSQIRKEGEGVRNPRNFANVIEMDGPNEIELRLSLNVRVKIIHPTE